MMNHLVKKLNKKIGKLLLRPSFSHQPGILFIPLGPIKSEDKPELMNFYQKEFGS